MRLRASRRAWLSAALGLGAAEFWRAGVARAAPSVRLQIVAAKNSALRDISFPDLRQLYRGKHIPISGLRVIPFNHPAGTPDRVGFDRVVLGMSPEEVGRFWVDQKIRGGDPPPRTIDSVALLLRVVAALDGSIAYVREGFLTSELKLLTIEGKMPSDSGYPLVY